MLGPGEEPLQRLFSHVSLTLVSAGQNRCDNSVISPLLEVHIFARNFPKKKEIPGEKRGGLVPVCWDGTGQAGTKSAGTRLIFCTKKALGQKSRACY